MQSSPVPTDTWLRGPTIWSSISLTTLFSGCVHLKAADTVGHAVSEPARSALRVVSSYSVCAEYYEVYDVPVCLLASGEQVIVRRPIGDADASQKQR